MQKRLLIFILLTGIVIISVAFGFYFLKQPVPSQVPSQQPNQQQETVTIETTDSEYKSTSTKPTGWFTTGQDADIMLSGIDFNNSGGPFLFNHPGTVASDGVHLLLADRNNNRVLIWNSLPEDNTPPDLVLGQPDLISNNPGTGLDQFNWPVSVATANGKVIVTDTYNHRILIWNSFPTTNGQPADLVITDDKNNPKRNVGWPWAVWTDGEKVVVTSTAGSKVLIWNTFPTETDEPADLYLTANGQFGTPRSIGSDGAHLVIGDHNAKVNNGAGNFFWKTFPTSDDQPYDFFMARPESTRPGLGTGTIFWGPIFTADGKFAVLTSRLHIWNTFPQDENDQPDRAIGTDPPPPGSDAFRFNAGDGSSMTLAGEKLYISVSNGNLVAGYNTFPSSENQRPDFVIGSTDFDTNTLEANYFITNPVPATDGKSLFISSDFDRKLYVYTSLPDESGAQPDFVYSLAEAPWDNELYGETLALAGKRTVSIWTELPLAGEPPDVTLQDTIGSVTLQGIAGVALDDQYFYLADGDSIYVWEGIPSATSDPKFTLSIDRPRRLSSDGTYLAVTTTFDHKIVLYSVATLAEDAQPVGTIGGVGHFNLPEGALVSEGHVFVADTGFNRVLIWNDISDAIAGRDADVILGAETLQEVIPEIGKPNLFWPASLAFDGSYLWVGEYKFSGRVLRFSVQ